MRAMCVPPGDEVVLRRAGPADRPVMARLWQLYLHDLSEFRGLMPGADGRYPEHRMVAFFTDPDRAAHLVRVGDAPAGFVLVRGLQGTARVMGEFFVVRAARRRGVGHVAARAALAGFPGPWEIPFQEANAGAARFWRRVATVTVGEEWHEEARPVPGRPELEPDVWLSLVAPGSAR